MYDASVLKAFSPYFAGSFLMRNGKDGWLQLGGILLAFTGVETLFADLGAFSQRYVSASGTIAFGFSNDYAGPYKCRGFFSSIPAFYCRLVSTIQPAYEGRIFYSLLTSILVKALILAECPAHMRIHSISPSHLVCYIQASWWQS